MANNDGLAHVVYSQERDSILNIYTEFKSQSVFKHGMSRHTCTVQIHFIQKKKDQTKHLLPDMLQSMLITITSSIIMKSTFHQHKQNPQI